MNLSDFDAVVTASFDSERQTKLARCGQQAL